MKLKKPLLILLPLVISVGCLVSFNYFYPSREKYVSGLKDGVTLTDFTSITIGMHEDDLIRHLGEALQVRNSQIVPSYEQWYYSEQVEGVWRWPEFYIGLEDGKVRVVNITEYDRIDVSRLLYHKSAEDEIGDLVIFE